MIILKQLIISRILTKGRPCSLLQLYILTLIIFLFIFYNKEVIQYVGICEVVCVLWPSLESGHPGEARSHGQAPTLLEEDAVRLD